MARVKRDQAGEADGLGAGEEGDIVGCFVGDGPGVNGQAWFRAMSTCQRLAISPIGFERVHAPSLANERCQRVAGRRADVNHRPRSVSEGIQDDEMLNGGRRQQAIAQDGSRFSHQALNTFVAKDVNGASELSAHYAINVP